MLFPRLCFLIPFAALLFSASAAPVVSPMAPQPPLEADMIHPAPKIAWETIAELPPRPGMAKTEGLAGVFAGAQGDVLLIAGGTNYAGLDFTKGPKRAWWADIYVLQRSYTPEQKTVYQWLPAGAELPRNLAYGASANIPDGVLCMGGAEMEKVTDACFVMRWNAEAKKVEFIDYPKLPKPLACATAVRIGNIVYLIGGTGTMPAGRATNTFLALDLTKKDDPANFAWKELRAWDGPARIFPIAAASLENGVESIYLCGGRDPGNTPDFLTDLHKYNPIKKDWAILGDIVDPRGHPSSVMAAPAFHVPPHHLVVVSGTDEELVRMFENNTREFEAVDAAEEQERQQYNKLLLENYPGYTRTVMAYDAEVGEWSALSNFPGKACLTTPTVNWDGAVIIPGGETGPGKRSGLIWQGTVRKKAAVVEE